MKSIFSRGIDLRNIDTPKLVSLCANNSEDSELWSEFLRRFTPKIKTFIQSTLQRYTHRRAENADSSIPLDANQRADLFQNTILRLVQNGCAALKRFSGTTESDMLAYLAVIARSVVRDFMRRQSALRRFSLFPLFPLGHGARSVAYGYKLAPAPEDSVEREVLMHEVEQLSLKTIRNNSPEPDRDQLIFQLYYTDGLSAAQIAACRGINLSKTGIEKMLNRLEDRVRSAASAHSSEARES
jgi:RNA polymerase sigma factor (sigma-70 family)